MKTAAQTLRQNPKFNAEEVITELGAGVLGSLRQAIQQQPFEPHAAGCPLGANGVI